MLCGHRLRKKLKDDQSFTVLKNELHMDFFKAIKGSQFRYRFMCRKSEVILAQFARQPQPVTECKMKLSSPSPFFCQNAWMYALVNVQLLKRLLLLESSVQRSRCRTYSCQRLMVLMEDRVRSALNFFSQKKSRKKEESRVTSLLPLSPQRVGGFSPVGRHPRIRNGMKEKNHFCGLEPSNPAAAYDQRRKFYASVRDSAMVSGQCVRPFIYSMSPFNMQFQLFF